MSSEHSGTTLYPHRLAGAIDDLRAYTEPISNAVANTAACPLEVLDELARGCLPPSLLPVILHETTHFVTYFTPVGAALASLGGAAVADPAALIADQEEVAGPAATAVAAKALHRLFTPVVEGLAVFAEFDLHSGRSAVASTMMTAVLKLFAYERLMQGYATGVVSDPLQVASRLVAEVRTTPECQTRKMMLYRSPMDVGDGYLSGYLWVKRLWRMLIQDNPRLEETELFLCFLIDFLFSDFKLAQLVQAPILGAIASETLPTYAEMIANYVFGDRLAALFSNTERHLQQYERQASQSDPGAIFNLQSQVWRPDYQNFDPQMSMQLELGMQMGAAAARRPFWPKYLSGRHVLRVLGVPASVTLEADGRFKATSLASSRSLEGQTLEAARPHGGGAASGRGTIEALFLIDQFRPVIGVFIGAELLATFDPQTREENDPKAVKACDALSSYLSLETVSEKIHEDTQFQAGGKAARLLAEAIERIIPAMTYTFETATLSADNGQDPSDETLDRLRTGGVAALLADEPGLDGRLAALSLSAGGQVVSLAQAAEHWGVDEAMIDVWLMDIQQAVGDRLGWRVFQRRGDRFGWGQL